jgi:hypothetical protein
MAKARLFNYLHGRVGDTTYFTRNGRTYAMQANVNKRKVTRKAAQMATRTNWSNLVNFWKAFPCGARPYFEGLRPGVTHYNHFFTLNLGSNRIFLTKEMAGNCACVVVPFIVSTGILPPIVVDRDDVGVRTNISLGDLNPLPTTTLGQLSQAIIKNNNDFHYKDIILYLLVRQHVDPTDGRPFISMSRTTLILNPNSNTPIQHLLHPLEGFAARNGMLAASVDPVGGMVWVHARCTSHNCLHVSTQHIVCNNQALINHYSSPEAFDAACQSYGGLTDDPMLKPNE